MGLSTAAQAQPAGLDASPERWATQTVVVSATRHAMAMLDAPAAMSVVTRDDLAQRGADNLLDALRGELGVSLMARPISGRKAISLRGMDSRHTLMLVDGKRIGASDGVIGHSDFQNDWIAVEDIERIEVIRGPMSVLYGAEALGGVVNIVTRPLPGAGQAWRFEALAEGGFSDSARGGDGHRAALRATGPLGAGLALAVSAAETQRDAVAAPADARISDLEARRKRDAAVLLQWRGVGAQAGQRVDLEHRQGDEDRSAGMVERSGAKRFFSSDTAIARVHDALGWQADWGGDLEWRTQLRVYRSAVDMDNRRSNGVAALRPNRLRDRVVEGHASLQPHRAHLLTMGFEHRTEVLLNNGLPGGRAEARHGALYLQDEWQVGPRLAWTAGLRADQATGFGRAISPRLYAVWQAAPSWTVKGGIGRGFKAPTLKQISPGYAEDEGPFTYHGQAGLRPETNDSVELGIGWNTPEAGVQAMVFDNRVHDLIVARPTTVVAGRQHYVFDNLDQARLRGLELSGQWALGQDFKLSLNHLLLDARDGQGARLDKRARHTLGLRLVFARGPVDAGLHLEHTRGLVLATAVAGQAPQPVPAFSMLGSHLRLRVTPALELGLAVDNLGNLRLADKSPLVTQAEVPRTWRLSLRGRW